MASYYTYNSILGWKLRVLILLLLFWHEQGVYDLPAMIDYILEETGAKKLSYAGHSEGTTVFFVMGSEKPEYNDKISIAVQLGPAAFMTNISSPVVDFLDQYLDILTPAVDLLGIHEIPSTRWSRIIGEIVCNDASGLQELCVLAAGLICGFDPKLNSSVLPTVLTNFPAGVSVRQLIHYGQEKKSGHFRKYDFGFVSNLLKYGAIEPPDYNISAISAHIALFYSNNDFNSAACNVEQLASKLPNVVRNVLMPYEFWNHFDYVWGNDVKAMLYDQIVELFDKYKR